MLQKLPLVICIRHFFSLNVIQSVFHRVLMTLLRPLQPPCPFIFAYMERTLALVHITMLESAHSWSFSPKRKKNPWKPNLCHKIARVFPQFTSIPPFDSSTFEPFCWSELLLYKPFWSIPHNIGTTTFEIISH